MAAPLYAFEGAFVEADSCSACPAGTFTSIPNDETSCELCPRGKSSNAGSTSCNLITIKMPDGCKGIAWNDRTCYPKKAVDDWLSTSVYFDLVVATYGPIENWDMSEVTDMGGLFNEKGMFNSDLAKWDVSNVINMFAIFHKSGFKRTLCGSSWKTLTGDQNAFTHLGSGSTISTARYGCCSANKYMSSPEAHPFKEVNSCSACPIGQVASSVLNDDTSCQKECPATQVDNSDKAATDSLTGIIDASVTITCDPGWSGSGTTVCGTNLQWSTIPVCSAKSCAATQIANSDKAETNSITGKFQFFSFFFFLSNNFQFPAGPHLHLHTCFLFFFIHKFSCTYIIQVQLGKQLVSPVTLAILEVVLLPVVQTVNLIH